MKKNELVDIGEFAIFDEDSRYKEGDLQKIVDVNNARIQDTGDAIPIVLGHTKENAEETEQPAIVGWAKKLRLMTIGKLNPRAAIVATFEIIKDCVETVKNYPRRSVELWENDMIIDPIALLGSTRPAKNLGLMTFASLKTGTKVSKYYEEGKDMADITLDKDALVKLIHSTIEDSEIGQWVHSQLIKPEAESEKVTTEEVDKEEVIDEAQEGAEVEGDKVVDPAEAAEEGKEIVAEDTKETKVEEEIPEKKEADGEATNMEEGTTPGGDNTFIPSFGGKKDKECEKCGKAECNCKSKHEAVGEVTDYQADVIARYRKDALVAREEAAELAKQVCKFAREKELLKLVQEYSFEVEEEMKLTNDFNDAQFVNHLNVIRTRYSRIPVGRGAHVYPVVTDESGSKPPMTLEKVNKAIEIASKTKCSFEEALKQVR